MEIIFFNDFSHFTWVFFLKHKEESFLHFHIFRERVEKEDDFSILRIRSDRDGEFNSQSFITYSEDNRIKHELSCPRTLQQNRVVERKN